MLYLATFIAALAVTMVLIPPMIQFAGRLQLLDRPDERKVHEVSIPRVGGIGMVLGALVPILIWVSLDREVLSYIVGVGILLVFGIWDDRGDLDFRLKFLGQILAAAIVVGYGETLIRVVPFLGLDPVSGWVAIPLTVFVIVAVTNAVNLADGLDGLASGTTLLSLGGIALLAYLSNGTELLLMAVAVMGGIVGFLRFNTHPARVFMGDTGSQFLGFSAGVLAIMLTQEVNPALNPALPLLLLGLPLFDTAFVIAKRIKNGRLPFVADKNHIHHQLLRAGFDQYGAVVSIYVVQSFFVASAVLFRYQTDLFVVGYWVIANVLFALALVGASRWHWVEHRPERASLIATWISNTTGNPLLMKTPLAILRMSVAGLLAIGPVLVSDVPVDIGAASGVLFVVLLLRLVFGFRLWFMFLRLLLFVAIATVIYLGVTYPGQLEKVPQFAVLGFFGLVVVALVVGARFSQKDAFRVTPTDILVVLVFLGVAVAPRIGLGGEQHIAIAVKALIMFYAVEFILRNMESRWCALTLSALWAFGVIGARGAVLG